MLKFITLCHAKNMHCRLRKTPSYQNTDYRYKMRLVVRVYTMRPFTSKVEAKMCQSRKKTNVIFGFINPKYIYQDLFGPLTIMSRGLALELTVLTFQLKNFQIKL